MNGLGSNYSPYNSRIGFGTSLPLKDLTEKQTILPNLNNIGVNAPVSPEVAPKLPNFGLTLNRKQIEEKEDKSKNGKLDLSEVGKNFLKGIGGFAIEIVKHPIKSIAVAAGVGVLTTLCPPLAGIMIGGAAIGGVFSLGGGILKAGISLATKNWDGFEKSFEDTGSGLSTMVMSAFMARGFNKLKLKGAEPLTEFKFSKEGVTTWAKESFSLAKKLGTENYRSALNLAQANLKGILNTITKPKGKGFLSSFTEARASVIDQIHKTSINTENSTPTGFFDKIRFRFAKGVEGKNKFIGEIQARAKADVDNLELSNDIMSKVPTALKNAWTYLPDTDNSVSLSPSPLDLQM